MEIINLIAIDTFCNSHEIEVSIIHDINQSGLIELVLVENNYFIKIEHLSDLEKIIRLYRELNVNTEGISAIFHLLNKINFLQEENIFLKNRLGVYENE